MRSKLIPGKIKPISFTLVALVVIVTFLVTNFLFNFVLEWQLERIENATRSTQTAFSSEDNTDVGQMFDSENKSAEFVITHYCACMTCCGKTDGITKSGTQATVNRTVAVDPEIIPLGTELIIDGQTYIAEDTGAFKGYQIDIFVSDHETAIGKGIGMKEVLIYEN